MKQREVKGLSGKDAEARGIDQGEAKDEVRRSTVNLSQMMSEDCGYPLQVIIGGVKKRIEVRQGHQEA